MDGPCQGRYNHIGHNLIEMEMESEVHAVGCQEWEADVGSVCFQPGSDLASPQTCAEPDQLSYRRDLLINTSQFQ